MSNLGLIKLTCKLGIGKNSSRILVVDPSDQVHILMKKLGINDIETKFLANGKSYAMAGIYTFNQIDIKTNTVIYIINEAIAGYINN